METYSSFDRQEHLRPDFSKNKFESLHDWDFGWEILSPINIATDEEDSEIQLSKRLSPGQKALYFFWYLDAQVTNGGFIQFYWNGYRKYMIPIRQGLQLIGDIKMLELLKEVDDEYMKHEARFTEQRALDDWEPLYEELKNFDDFDSTYYQIHNQTMALIEKYIRANPDQFVNLVN